MSKSSFSAKVARFGNGVKIAAKEIREDIQKNPGRWMELAFLSGMAIQAVVLKKALKPVLMEAGDYIRELEARVAELESKE